MISLVLILLTIIPLAASEAVHVRGFLYQSKEGYWILADAPNLRSCCVEGKDGHSKHLRVEGDLQTVSTGRAVTLTGRIVDGKLIEASFVPESENEYGSWHYGAMALLSIAGLYAYRKHRKKVTGLQEDEDEEEEKQDGQDLKDEQDFGKII